MHKNVINLLEAQVRNLEFADTTKDKENIPKYCSISIQ